MDWLKYIYEKFFLRDLLGKITPGLIELYALFHLAGVNEKLNIGEWPWPLWVVVAAAALVTGLGFQTLGEGIGIHSPTPRARRILFFFPAKGKWKKINDDFRERLSMISQATKEQWTANAATQRERYVYLKEGSGNIGTAVLLLVPVCTFQDPWLGRALLAALAILLIATHFIHANRQAAHELHSLWRTAKDDKTKCILKKMAKRLDITLEDSAS